MSDTLGWNLRLSKGPLTSSGGGVVGLFPCTTGCGILAYFRPAVKSTVQMLHHHIHRSKGSLRVFREVPGVNQNRPRSQLCVGRVTFVMPLDDYGVDGVW